jgi:beta-lactamase regulating signal transducer with metallopeptidase domain
MDYFIESSNQWGVNFLNFAWPMLWQSSLLIVAVFVFDFLFRRKLRASIRYALWLVVLVKLCVPPTLALPTSPAWWLHKTQSPIAAKAKPHYTVTYDNEPLPETPQIPLPAYVPPKPAMIPAAWLLATSAIVSLTLLAWLLVRWWQVTGQVCRAKTSERLTALAGEAQKLIGTKCNVQVKLTTNSMSPAVCGLFHPAILIPQSLAEQFTNEQLRAVLLHELIHVRRRDVWVNFAQALLPIIYWWHPLVWLANARIRRVREEAVDDAVMIALRDEAESYAPTLLEVAKLALNRPLASLGLVGIMESRHALRQRIERLVDFRPPRRAGLTLASLLGIAAFTAVAVPMGDGPTGATNLSNSTDVPESLYAMNFAIISPMDDNSLKKILLESGVNIPPTIFFYKDGRLLVRGSREQLALVNRIVLKLNGYSSNDIEASDKQFPDQIKGIGFEGNSDTNLFSRHFKVGTTKFISTLRNTPGLQTNNVSTMAKSLLSILGVDWESPKGKAIFYNDRLGELFVRATLNDFDTVERALVVIQPGETNNQIRSGDRESFGGTNSNVAIKTNFPIGTNVIQNKIEAGTLVQDAKLDYEMGKLDEAERLLNSALRLDAENAAAKYYLGLVQASRQRQIVTKPSEGRQEIVRKLQTIRWDSLSFEALPLSEVVRILSIECKKLDPDHRGFNFMINPNPDLTAIPMVDSITGLPTTNTAVIDSSLNDMPITINPPLTNIALGDVLSALVLVAPKPMHYSVEDYAIVFRPGQPLSPLYSRHFRVDPNKFRDAMEIMLGISTNSVPAMARDVFKKLGVDLDLAGKSVFFNDRLGELFVRASAQDLDTIENVLEVLNNVPPQIHIKARFLEVPKGTLDGLKRVISVTNQLAGLVGILTDENFRTVLHSLEALPGAETLAEPEVVTTSGRQTQMRATTLVGEDVVYGVIVEKLKPLEIGPSLDVVPYVLSDGYTINLTLIPSLTELLVSSNSVPKHLQDFHARQAVTTLNLWDNQTAIISGLPENDYIKGKEVFDKSKASDKELLVFVTATILDHAGNRIHSDEELPFAKDGIPPQPRHE